MAEIDPLILQLRADLNGYLTGIRNATTTVDQQLGRQEARARQLEQEFSRTSGSIKGHLAGIAGALAAGFSVNKVVEMADSFTRFQNSLKVAGLEGQSLAAVQENLFQIANKYQTQLESVGGLYGRAAQNADALGASQAQLVGLTTATSASLKISGTSAVAAQGAFLGLGQALGQSRVSTEEFNQMMEGGLYPVLQEAAKHIDGTGGTLAGLKNKMQDMKGAGVSNVQLFQAITASVADLESRAAKASGTISGAFTVLSNNLTRYVGEADKANGATAAMTQAITGLANNLDTIIPALATIAALVGVKYVASALAAAGANVVKAAADVRATQTASALAIAQAEVAGMMNAEAMAAARASAAVTGLSVAQGVAMRGGSALAAAMGGPWGIALAALAAGLVYIAIKTNEVTPATKAYQVALDQSALSSKNAADLAMKLSNAHGAARDAAISAARESKKLAEQNLKTAKTDLIAAQAALKKAQAYMAAMDAGALTGAETSNSVLLDQEGQAQANVRAASGRVKNYEAQITQLSSAIAAAEKPITAGKMGGGSTPKKTGPTVAETAARHEEEMQRLAQEQLRAELDITTDAGQRASISRDLLDAEYRERRAQIEADKHYTQAQKQAQIAALNKLYGTSGLDAQGNIVVSGKPTPMRQAIKNDEQRQLEQEASDLARAQYDAQRDALQQQLDLADSTSERRRIALALVDLEYQYQKSIQQAILASGTATAAEKQRAAIAIKALDDQRAGKVTAAERSNESPLATYARGLNKSGGAITDQVEGYVVDELNHVRDGITSAITKAIGTDDPLITGLLNMLIEQILLKPIANALQGATSGTGGGDFFSGLLGSITGMFGRASGGSVQAGQTYRVNEGASSGRVEYFRPDVSGQIIPLGRVNALGGGGGANGRVFNISVDARNSVTPAGFAQSLSKDILAQAQQMDVQTAKAVTRSVPTRMNGYQRDGY
ncbi:tape measure protein [Novosphingobium sp. FSY-8]|uniref:Tape measure protein n=1 Tax=Novosphingobium ovatum TaxID=1908523 RepID=A0ABW9XG13_9SPHN|nr:tape measure protein [Novosphingobium ovatum]NBC37367.1 tape measure protein [Novosphingobium ovatum]